MAEIALLVAEELDKRRTWKAGDHGGARQEKRYRSSAMSPSTVSALGRRAQDEATTAAFLRIGPKEVALARMCLQPKSASFELPAAAAAAAPPPPPDGLFSA